MEQAVYKRSKVLNLLDEFQAEAQDCITIYLTPDSLHRPDGETALQLGALPEEIMGVLEDESVLRAAGRYESGLVLLWSSRGDGLVVLPPFEITGDKVSQGAADTEPLRRLLEKERLIGIILINWGSYAVGVFQGDTRLSSKVGTGHIHPRHKKGGSSQKRFARRTEEQKKEFLRRASNRVEQILQGYQLDHIFFGGNRWILKPLLDENVFLRSHTAQISPRSLKTTYSNQKSLLGSLEEAYESICFRW